MVAAPGERLRPAEARASRPERPLVLLMEVDGNGQMIVSLGGVRGDEGDVGLVAPAPSVRSSGRRPCVSYTATASAGARAARRSSR